MSETPIYDRLIEAQKRRLGAARLKAAEAAAEALEADLAPAPQPGVVEPAAPTRVRRFKRSR